MSNPRLDTTTNDQVLEIPATPPGDVRNNNAYSVGSYFSPTVSTALIIATWYLSNIGVLLLNKYLLSFHGYRYPIFLTMLHLISCSAYSSASINLLDLVPLQHIHSKQHQNRFNRSGSRFSRSNRRFPVFDHFFFISGFFREPNRIEHRFAVEPVEPAGPVRFLKPCKSYHKIQHNLQ
jgi:hypothetical protein